MERHVVAVLDKFASKGRAEFLAAGSLKGDIVKATKQWRSSLARLTRGCSGRLRRR